MNCLLFMMGGSGIRYGAEIPKQYVEICGKPLFAYTLETYCRCEFLDKVVIVSHADWIGYAREKAAEILGDKLLDVTAGGYTRSHSVKNGLLCCKKYLKDDDVVFVHDATNPLIDEAALARSAALAKEYGIAAIVTDQVHTLYRKEGDEVEQVIPRETVCSGYSPEVFRFSEIDRFYADADDQKLEKMTSAVALALDAGRPVKLVPADLLNLKITYPHDMNVFRAIVERQRRAAGAGGPHG